jgi:hypothetical protein
MKRGRSPTRPPKLTADGRMAALAVVASNGTDRMQSINVVGLIYASYGSSR